MNHFEGPHFGTPSFELFAVPFFTQSSVGAVGCKHETTVEKGWMGQRMTATVTSYRLIKGLDRNIRKQYSPLAA
jgi:hypothetical protein